MLSQILIDPTIRVGGREREVKLGQQCEQFFREDFY
jgi:hypothetical protein